MQFILYVHCTSAGSRFGLLIERFTPCLIGQAGLSQAPYHTLRSGQAGRHIASPHKSNSCECMTFLERQGAFLNTHEPPVYYAPAQVE